MALPAVHRAALWMGGTLLSFSAMAIAIRGLSPSMDALEILFFRSLIGLPVVVAAAALGRGGLGRLRSGQPGWQGFRNIVHFGGQWGWTAGIGMLPLATVFALEFTMPVWSALIAVTLLRERMNPGRIAALVLGFVGILVIVRPGLVALGPGAIVVLVAAACYAAAHTTTKRLTRTDGPLAILFWMCLLQLPLGLAGALLSWVAPTAEDVLPLLVVGLTALSAHYCFARALSLADASVVIPLDFLRLPLIAAVGFALYGEPVDAFVLGGGLLIVAGTYGSVWYEGRGRTSRSSARR